MKPFNIIIIIIYLVVCFLHRGIQLIDKILFSEFTYWHLTYYLELGLFFRILCTDYFFRLVWKKGSTNTLK